MLMVFSPLKTAGFMAGGNKLAPFSGGFSNTLIDLFRTGTI